MSTAAWRTENVEKLRAYRLKHYYKNREHYIAQVKEAQRRNRQELLATDEQYQSYIAVHPVKVCCACSRELPTIEFPTRSSNGKRYPNHECANCQNARRRSGKHSVPTREQKLRRLETQKQRRRDRSLRPRYILQDCRRSDKKHGRVCDLDYGFVETAIASGCSYCRAVDSLMTLDRIDNSRGHLKDNVVACCYRCNSIRCDMPYEAWKTVVPAVREAYERNQFGDWLRHGRS